MKSEVPFALENATWPALIVEQSGKIARINGSARELLGPAANEGFHLANVWSHENTGSANDFLNSIDSAVASSPLLKFRLKDGTTGSFTTYAAPMGAEEEPYFILQLFKQASHAVPATPRPPTAVDANAAHKQKLDCAMQLARTVALDFNNALTSILGHTSLLLSKAEAEHPWRWSLVEIEKSAEKAAEIANDLANFSRQEKETKQATGNLNELLQRTIEAFRIPDNAHVTFDLQFERHIFATAFDEAKMQQAFAKIVENAVQAVDAGGQILVASRNIDMPEPFQDGQVKLGRGTYVCVEIADNGCGIEPESLPRIFEPFFTTKGTNHRGLGLAWVYGIVTNHGGGVAVSSEPAVGTSVRVYLPATKKVMKDTTVTMDDLCGVETVLVVDDEDLLLNMAQTVLSAFGYRALVANSGPKALEVLSQEPVDLVITDLVMPNMSGRELMDRIRALAPETRIICSSGYVRPGNKDEENYLQKPFTAQELLRRVKQTLMAEQPA